MIALDLKLPLADFALEVKAQLDAEAVALMGPSGSGKTSLLEAIAGLRPGATGRIAVGEDVLLDSSAALRLPPEARRIGWVPQDARLFPHLNVEANVAFGKGATSESARWALSLTETAHLAKRWPAALSGGERQRVALARALAIRPRLLLLDEPLAALDEGLKGRILPQLLRVRAEAGIPLVYVTHQRAEAELLGGALMLLERGKVAHLGKASELVARLPASGDSGENIILGDFLRTPEGARLRLAGGPLLVVPDWPSRPEGTSLWAVRAEDLLLATAPIERISARNVLEGRVVRVEQMGDEASVWVEAVGRNWRSKVTSGTVGRLGLKPGERAWLVVKAHAFAPVG